MAVLAGQIHAFAGLLIPREGKAENLTAWITRSRSAGLPFLRSFANGLARDRAAVNASLTLPHHIGRTEGANTKIKLLKRLMHGRAGHRLLRHIILLN
ncbi:MULTISPECIES: transposase [unclassified Streptomyces]|uniref:transposase n=1 Tax=unclassified Streptomyces TaxID=2593676 RepID=UPI003076CBBE